MIAVYENPTSNRRHVAGEFDTFAEAEAFVRSAYGIVFFEVDEDYPNCADAYTTTGICLAIQPTNFTL